MGIGHLFERGAVDLVHLRIVPRLLAGIDLDRMGDAHVSPHDIAHELEEGQI